MVKKRKGRFDSKGKRHLTLVPGKTHKQKELAPKEFFALSGSELLNTILELDNPKEMIRNLPLQDFYWIVKKIGEDDCLPVLEMGTKEQWQHVMDLEIWERDRLDLKQAFNWLKRLQLADTMEVAKWLFSEAQHFAYYFFYRSIQVEILKHDDPLDLPDGFFTLDGVFYIRAKDTEQRETLEQILRAMAHLDFERYHNFIIGLSGVLPAELEEELFRWRNVRLAEHGFLPFDEAFSVYSALPPESLHQPTASVKGEIVEEEEVKQYIPLAPLYHTQEKSLLAEIASRIKDPVFLDRLRLEFAGLCNQILSADGLNVKDFETLVKTCKRAAAYLNIALEKASDHNVERATQILKQNILLTVFRVGFGYALKAKWEAERWVKRSWFVESGLNFSFWGEEWGGILEGLLKKKPLFFAPSEEGEFRDFEKYSEIERAKVVSNRIRVLDKMLRELSEKYSLKEDFPRDPDITFHLVVFTVWANNLLGHAPSIRAIPLTEAKQLFKKLREKESAPPYKMAGYKAKFIEFFTIGLQCLDQHEISLLSETLALLWEQFREEYEWVKLGSLDSRFSRFVRIKPSA